MTTVAMPTSEVDSAAMFKGCLVMDVADFEDLDRITDVQKVPERT